MEIPSTPFPLNTPLPFFGVDNHLFKLGDAVYEAVEDPDDGYRSYLGSIEVRGEDGIFFGRPIDTVVVHEFERGGGLYSDSPDVGYELKSTTDGHVWLRFGTANTQDYYPWFLWEYQPRAPDGK